MDQLRQIYYDPTLGLRSAESLYRRSQEAGLNLTRKQVTDFYKKQATSQIFHQRKLKHFFALSGYSSFGRVQIDLLDTLSLGPANLNGGTHFIMNCVDVYTRYAFSLPLKSKNASDCLRAFQTVVHEIELQIGFPPYQVDSDSESSFQSSAWRKYCKDNDIVQHFVPIGEKNPVGVVESYNKTLRQLLQRYLVSHQTKKFVTALPQVVKNYNTSYHSSLKGSPQEALDGKVSIDNYIMTKNARARKEIYNKIPLEVGDKVRLLLKKRPFQKGTEAKFTKTVHTITKIQNHEYSVTDRDGFYLKRELLKVDEVEHRPQDEKDEKDEDSEPEEKYDSEEEKRERRNQRRLEREGLAPHRYQGDPTNSLEYRQRQEMEQLPQRRSRYR